MTHHISHKNCIPEDEENNEEKEENMPSVSRKELNDSMDIFRLLFFFTRTDFRNIESAVQINRR